MDRDLESLPVTQVINSPPPSAESPVPRTPAKHSHAYTHTHSNPASHTYFLTPGTRSHDRAGNLSLAYSNSLAYSPADLEDTQIDHAPYELTQIVEAGDPPSSGLEMVRSTPDNDDDDAGLEDTWIIDADTPAYFSSPQPASSPIRDPAGHNPLSHMTLSSRVPLSLAQIFDAASSPWRPGAVGTVGTSLPPTPSAAEATRLMARSLGEHLLVPRESSPVSEAGPGSPVHDQPNPVTAYVSMQESQEARERNAKKRLGWRRGSLEGSLSPEAFNSSFVLGPRRAESDDGMGSPGEETRRRADKARRKGDEEVKRLFTAVKASRGLEKSRNTAGRARSEEASTKKNLKRTAERTVAALRRRQTKSASPLAGEETGDEEEEAPAVARKSTALTTASTATTEEDDVSLPMNPPTPIPPPLPEKPLASSSVLQTQYTQLPPQDWESVHRVPAATAIRRTRSNPVAAAAVASPSPGYTPPVSTIADSQPTLPPQRTWLRSLPPFNIPSSSPSLFTAPRFVPETSGLVPQEPELEPMVLETSPLRAASTDTPVRKRKRRSAEVEAEMEMVPCSVEEVCSVDVDMGGFGDGDLEGMGVTPRAAGVKRIRMTPRVMDVDCGVTEQTAVEKAPEVVKSASSKDKRTSRGRMKSKALIRKTRSSRSAAPDTPTPVPGDTEDEADILTSNNPAFRLSAAVADATVTVPGRVFALFRDGKTSYHPATVLDGDPYTGTVRVVFDDGTEDRLERAYVRALDLRAGDAVKVDLMGMKKVSWVVHGFGEPVTPAKLTDCRGHTMVALRAKKTGPVGEVVEVPVTSIYLVKSMWKDFHARVYHEPSTTASCSDTRHATPAESFSAYSAPTTPSKALRHTPNTGSSLARGGLFAGMVFALSFGDREGARKATASKILQHGGRILDAGFEDLFHDTTGSNSSPELTPRPEAERVGFAAVIADTHSRRAKFLQALALGLPCLAPRWVEDCCRRAALVGWEHYLLPAGESRYIGAVRSRVLETYDARAARMQGVVARRGKMLQGRGVVVVTGARTGEKRVRWPLCWFLGCGVLMCVCVGG